jgi:replicative DNA helicase
VVQTHGPTGGRNGSAGGDELGSEERVPPPVLLADLLGELGQEAQRAWEVHQGKRPRGPATGMRSLDRVLGGELSVGLHNLHGAPGTGKTAWTLQAAGSCGCPALFVSCEMRPVELLRRHTARVTSTPLGDLKSGALTAEQVVAKAQEAAAQAPWLALLDATRGSPSPDRLYHLATALRERAGADHVLVAVDSAHAWAAGLPDAEPNEYERLSLALDALRALAMDLSCPVLAVAERNRITMENGGLNAAAGTRRFEYIAETMIGLAVATGKDAPAFSQPDTKPIRVMVEKNRNGDFGMALKATFFGRYQRFEEGGW